MLDAGSKATRSRHRKVRLSPKIVINKATNVDLIEILQFQKIDMFVSAAGVKT